MMDKYKDDRNDLGQFKAGRKHIPLSDYGEHIGTKGEDNLYAKLTEADVREIRRLRCEELVTEEIAQRFGVNGETVRAVFMFQSWTHVTSRWDARLRALNKRDLTEVKMTRERALKLFSYDPEEGILRWAVRRCRVRPGMPAGSLANGHLFVGVDKKGYYVTKIIWLMQTGEWPDRMVDHEDRNKINNKWSNLRLATRSQNGMNSKLRSDNTSGCRGVVKYGDKWHAYITVNGKGINLGSNLEYDEAVRRRKAAEIQHYGEFANVNRRK